MVYDASERARLISMLMHHRDIIGLPVYTKSNTHLGAVVNLIIDIESQSIIEYGVQPRRWRLPTGAKEYLVHRQQVISISKEKMIVDDVVVAARTTPRSASSIIPSLQLSDQTSCRAE